MDTRFTKMEQRLSERPLEKNLEFLDFGKYKLANTNTHHAFTKLNCMCNQDIDSSSSEEASEIDKINDNDEGNDNGGDANKNQETG